MLLFLVARSIYVYAYSLTSLTVYDIASGCCVTKRRRTPLRGGRSRYQSKTAPTWCCLTNKGNLMSCELRSVITQFRPLSVSRRNYYYSSLLYCAILCSQADSLRTCRMWFWMSDYPFKARIINIHGSGVLVALCGCCMAGATWNAAVSARVLCTPFNHAPGYSVTSFKAT